MRKSMITISVLILSLLCISVFAQVRTEGQTIENKEKLLKLADKYHQEYLIKRAEVERVAQEKGWLIREETDDALWEIQYIDKYGMPQSYITCNLNAARTVNTDDLWTGGSSGLNLDGTGYLIGEWDGGGVLTTHQEFDGRVTQMDSPGATHYHSTHVAGTIVAEGQVGLAQGMAHEGELNAYDWDADVTEMTTAAANGLTLSNHSYSWNRGWTWNSTYGEYFWYGNTSISTTEDYLFGFYDESAEDYDNIAYNAPHYLQVWAAANDRNDDWNSGHYVWGGSSWVWSTASRDPDGGTDGYDCIPQNGVAKNVLTVGAVNDITGGWSSPSDVVMSTFSSWGPTDDGRIKPDIVANGVNLYSTDDDFTSDYRYLDGTSMAAPSTTGTLALLQDYFQDLRGGTMLASSIKGLAINTANEAGPANGPDYMFGWGLLNATGAADLITTDDLEGGLIVEGVILNGQNIDYTYYCDGSSDIRVTLCWTDPPGTPPAASLNPTTVMLKHDLDLYVINASNTYFYPWSLNVSSPSSPATNTGYNYRDNVERTDIYSPAAGYYTIRVDEFSTLPAEGQAYSLIIQGFETEPSLDSYCDVTHSQYSNLEYIKNVTMGSIDNTTGRSPGGYMNYTGLTGEITKGSSESISMTFEAFSGDLGKVWVDWNQDGDFTDSGEEFALGSGDVSPYTSTISAPSNAVAGYTTMRVRLIYGVSLTPCGTYSYGETEDYMLYVRTPGLWTGAISTDWNNTGNWDDNAIPTSSTNVTIPSGCPYYPVLTGHLGINTATYTYDCNSLTINSGAQLTVDGGHMYNLGDLTVAGTLDHGGGVVYYSGSTTNLSGTMYLGTTTGWYGGTYHYSGSIFNQTGGDYYVETISLSDGCQFNGTGGITHVYVDGDAPAINTIEINDPDSYFYSFYVDAGANAALNNCAYDMEVTYVTNNYGPLTTNSYTLNTTYMNAHSELIINSGGTVNVTDNGPYFQSTGGYLTMIIGSTLNCGGNIRFYSGSTENVSGGEIFLGESFTDYDNIFSPIGGTFTFDGGSTSYINGPTEFYQLNINKTGADKSSGQNNGKDLILIDNSLANSEDIESSDLTKSGLQSDNSKANDVFLSGNVSVANDLTINSGALTLNGYELTVLNSSYFYGTLNMTNPADVYNAGVGQYDQFMFYNGSIGNITAGNIYLAWGTVVYNGATFTATTANTIHYNSAVVRGGIANDDPNTVFGNINVNKSAGYFQLWNDGSLPVVVDGDFNLGAGNEMEMQDFSLIVHGTLAETSTSSIYLYNYFSKDTKKGDSSGSGDEISEANPLKDSGAKGGFLEIDNSFTLNGLMDVLDGDVYLHGGFSIAATGILNIDGGTVIDDAPTGTDIYHFFHGSLNITSGLFEVTNNSIHFGSTATTNVSGGTLRSGGAFSASFAGTFQPTGGDVEITGLASDNVIYCQNGNYFNDLIINRTNGTTAYMMDETVINNDLTIQSGALSPYYGDDVYVGGDWINNVGPTGFLPNTGTVTFNNAVDVSLISIGGGNFYNLTIDKGAVGAAVELQDNADIANTTTINSGALWSYDNIISTNGNVTINNTGFLYIMANGVLELANAMSLNVNSGGALYATGSAGNMATVTHNSSGNYGFNINSGGLMGANYAVFEYMNGNGIYLLNGSLVHSTYTFNNCIFRNGHPAPSALLAFSNDASFTCNNAYFENSFGNTQWNVWKNNGIGNIEFIDATGDFAGEAFDSDPNNLVDWSYTTRTLDLTVLLEGPYNTATDKLDTDINGVLPIVQPYGPTLPYYGNPLPNWYYTGIESVGSIPNVFVVDWILLELRDATSAAAASSATTFETIPAFILNTGEIVGLDGLNPVIFLGSVINDLFVVVMHRNHLGIISANPLIEVAGTYSYDFSSGETQVYGGINGHKELEPGVWGMVAADGDGNGFIQLTDTQEAWTDDLGLSGYLGGDFDMNSLGQISDKQDVWLPNLGTGGQIPAKNVNTGYASQVPK